MLILLFASGITSVFAQEDALALENVFLTVEQGAIEISLDNGQNFTSPEATTIPLDSGVMVRWDTEALGQIVGPDDFSIDIDGVLYGAGQILTQAVDKELALTGIQITQIAGTVPYSLNPQPFLAGEVEIPEADEEIIPGLIVVDDGGASAAALVGGVMGLTIDRTTDQFGTLGFEFGTQGQVAFFEQNVTVDMTRSDQGDVTEEITSLLPTGKSTANQLMRRTVDPSEYAKADAMLLQTPAFAFYPSNGAVVTPMLIGNTLFLDQEGGQVTYILQNNGFSVLPYDTIIVRETVGGTPTGVEVDISEQANVSVDTAPADGLDFTSFGAGGGSITTSNGVTVDLADIQDSSGLTFQDAELRNGDTELTLNSGDARIVTPPGESFTIFIGGIEVQIPANTEVDVATIGTGVVVNVTSGGPVVVDDSSPNDTIVEAGQFAQFTNDTFFASGLGRASVP